MRIGHLLIIILTVISPSVRKVLACLWDNDTISAEVEDNSVTYKAITGDFDRLPNIYYEMRIERLKRLFKDGSANFGYYDDMAVAYNRLGNNDQAIDWMRKKYEALTRNHKKNEVDRDELFKLHANIGTFYAHRWIHKGAKRSDLFDLKLAAMHIATALEYDVRAHFGREKYQLIYIEWLLNPPENTITYTKNAIDAIDSYRTKRRVDMLKKMLVLYPNSVGSFCNLLDLTMDLGDVDQSYTFLDDYMELIHNWTLNNVYKELHQCTHYVFMTDLLLARLLKNPDSELIKKRILLTLDQIDQNHTCNDYAFLIHTYRHELKEAVMISNLQVIREYLSQKQELYSSENSDQRSNILPDFLGLSWKEEYISYRDGSFCIHYSKDFLNDAIRGVSGLIMLGNSWENVDAFYTLSLALEFNGAWELANLCKLRLKNLLYSGKSSIYPLKNEKMISVSPSSSENINDATKVRLTTLLRGNIEKFIAPGLEELNAEAEKERKKQILTLLRSGEHPDTHAGFWAKVDKKITRPSVIPSVFKTSASPSISLSRAELDFYKKKIHYAEHIVKRSLVVPSLPWIIILFCILVVVFLILFLIIIKNRIIKKTDGNL